MYRSKTIVAATLLSALCAAPAVAQEQESEAINVQQVDLSNNANWRQLDLQVAATAHRICEHLVGPQDSLGATEEDCEQRARDDAHMQMRAVLTRQQDAARLRFAAATPAPRG